MDPVTYTLFIQRTQAILCGLSFLFISAILTLTNPFSESYNLFLLLFGMFIFLVNFCSLLSFWWYISLQKQVLTTRQTNLLVIRSLFYATALVNMLVLALLGQLTTIPIILILSCLLLAHLWLPV
jgi:hypothetical protein